MPRAKTGGRKPGVPNKVTRDLRAMVMAALDKAGGQKYLQTQANKNPTAFMAMLGKCLPKDVALTGDLSISVTVQRLSDKGK